MEHGIKEAEKLLNNNERVFLQLCATFKKLLARKPYVVMRSNHAMYVLCIISTVWLCVATMLGMYYVLYLLCGCV